MTRALVALVLGGCAAWASISVPMLGYVPDGNRLRPVYGIPAAAAIGAHLNWDARSPVLLCRRSRIMPSGLTRATVLFS
jgi:hypothetical protein